MTDRDPPLRFVICHLHPLSARLRLLKSPAGKVIFPQPLPALAELLDNYTEHSSTAIHPAAYVRDLCKALAIEAERLGVVSGFRLWVDTPGRTLPLYLLQATTEQPFPAPEHCRWIEFMDCFGLSALERLLLRQIYDHLVGNG